MHEIEFYEKPNGKIPVMDFIDNLNSKMKAKALHDITLLEKHGSSLTAPYVKSIKGKGCKKLYELRIRHSNDIGRIFYFTFQNNKFILLHGFIKKTMKTPQKEIDKALNYMNDYKRRYESYDF